MTAVALQTSVSFFDVARFLSRSGACLLQNEASAPKVWDEMLPELQGWVGREELKDSVEPLARLIAAPSHPTREQIAQGICDTGANLCAQTDEWQVQETVSTLRRRLHQIVRSQPPLASDLFLSSANEGPREITSDLVKQQMFKMLAFYVAGVMHDANNTLTPVRMSISETKKEWQRLHALADQNKELLPEEPRGRMMAYLDVIGRHVDGIDRLVTQAAQMILDVQALLHPNDRTKAPSPEAIARLFDENGPMTQISFTLMKILRGLLDVDQNIQNLNEMAEVYGHLVPTETLQRGMDFLASISGDVETFRGLMSRIVDLFLSLRALKEDMKNLSPEPMNLHDHLEDRTLRYLLGKGIEVFFGRDEDPWPILAVSPFVWQVVVNLIVNARQAMQDSGRLSVSTRKDALDPEKAASLTASAILPRAQAGEYMVLRIEDTGPGIPAEILPRIFEAEFSGKKSIGLGLAVLLNLVEGMRGFVVLETSTGESESRARGTAFSVYFPRAV